MTKHHATHKRRKLVKTYKNRLPQKRTMIAKVCREIYSKKMIKSLSRKMTIDVKYTPQRGTLRERTLELLRERERYVMYNRQKTENGQRKSQRSHLQIKNIGRTNLHNLHIHFIKVSGIIFKVEHKTHWHLVKRQTYK